MNVYEKILSSHEREINVFGVPGAGKTQFACDLASQNPGLKFLYLSFGRENTLSADIRMSSNVDCFSFHSFAFNRMGMKGRTIKPKLNMGDIPQLPLTILSELKSMTRREAFLILLSRFSESRLKISESLRLLEEKGVYPTLTTQDKAAVYRALTGYFSEINKGDKKLPITHNAYLKKCALLSNWLKYDVVIADEAQDLNPAMFSLLDKFKVDNPNVRIIRMGDPMQQIFGFIGACSDFTNASPHLRLNKSNRFGEPLVSYVNAFAESKFVGDFTPIKGNGSASFVKKAPLAKSIKTHIDKYPGTAIISRYNATLWNWMRLLADEGISFHLVGNLFEKEIDFIQGLYDLHKNKKSNHPALRGLSFSRFKKNAQANDLTDQILACRFIESIKEKDDFMSKIRGLHKAKGEAEISLTTVHQAKGLEFPYVWIAGDHKNPREPFTPEEVKVFFTALTRAKNGVFLPTKWS